jgi:hypothetical protein
MSTYSLAELLRRWAQGELSAEQAIGQLLQHQQSLDQQLTQLRQQVSQLEQQQNRKP